MLLETTITDIYPAPFNTADCKTIGDGDDGQQYIIKQCSDNKYTPATEFICCSIAERCNIACLDHRQVVMPDKSIAFGSRFEAGQLKQADVGAAIITPSTFFSQTRSATYILDLFLGNQDRHINNFFLYIDANQNIRAKVFDFGRSLWGLNGVLPNGINQPPNANTLVTFNSLRKQCQSDTQRMNSVVDYLNDIDQNTIDDICKTMPSQWLTTDMKDSLEVWWEEKKPSRILELREGINHGKLV